MNALYKFFDVGYGMSLVIGFCSIITLIMGLYAGINEMVSGSLFFIFLAIAFRYGKQYFAKKLDK